MAKVPVHFTGFLANVGGDSVTRLQLGDGFVIQSDPPSIESEFPSHLAPFLERIDFHWGKDGLGDISPEGSYRVTKLDVAECEVTDERGAAIDWRVQRKAHDFVQDKLRLLKLLKEGNIILAYSFLYHKEESEPTVFGPMGGYPIVDRMPFTLTPAEVSEAQSLMDTLSFPLPKPLDLAFASFESSYKNYDLSLTFLSLMISMEVMLGPESPGELTHQVSRNAAVLLGADRSESQEIYRDMKCLYAERSKIVHAGTHSKHRAQLKQDMLTLRQYVRRSIRELYTGECFGKERVQKTLNLCGFGERPWREGR